jgi:GTP-binding protein EngB required for normal cell division
MNDPFSEVRREQSEHFNEPQKGRILSAVSQIDKLLIDIDGMLSPPSSCAVPKYRKPPPLAQVQVARDYMKRLRQQMVSILGDLDIRLPEPQFDSIYSIRVTLQFIEVAIEETSPGRLIGYGDLPATLSARLAGGLQELKGIVRQMDSYMIQRPEADLGRRIATISSKGTLTDLLSLLASIIERHRFVEFRLPLSRVLEKVESPTYEIAFFGRVSAGKSSLLNRLIATDLLPTGVTPITAVPTRVRNRSEPAVLVWTGDGRFAKYEIDRLVDFVTEERNPGNEKRATRVIVEVPLKDLREEVVLVDTPGLGSLALDGAAETLAYLPQCTLNALRTSSIPAVVVLSKVDLIPQADVDRLIDYTSRLIEEQLGSKVNVGTLSIRPEMNDLVESWVADQIAPRMAESRRLADESNRRKANYLAERVLHALRMAAGKTDSIRPQDRAEMKRLEIALRESASLIESTNNQCFELTKDIRSAAGESIRFLADAGVEEWRDGASNLVLDSNWIRKHANAIAQAKAQELAAVIQTAGRTLSTALNEAAAAFSVGGMNESFSLERTVKELPAPDFPGGKVIVRRPRSLSVSVKLARHSLIRQFESKCGPDLDTFFGLYGRALELWFRNILIALEKEFNDGADVYRALFQRQTGLEVTDIPDKTALAADLRALQEFLGCPYAVQEADFPVAI